MNVADKLGLGPKRVVRELPISAGEEFPRYEITVTPGALSGVNKSQTVVLSAEQYGRYRLYVTGQLMIHNALPDLTDDQREILQSGIGPEDWDRMFKDDE